MTNEPEIKITDSENPEENQVVRPPTEQEIKDQTRRRAEVMQINREQVAALNVNNAGACAVLLANLLTKYVDPDNGMVKAHPPATDCDKIAKLARAAGDSFQGSFN
jgi:hypothetical protein